MILLVHCVVDFTLDFFILLILDSFLSRAETII